MFRSISNIPIFRRLFLAFALAALIPGIVIIVLSSNYINTLSTRSQDIQTSNSAVKMASSELADLQRMNALLNEYFVAETNSTDPSMHKMPQALNTQILDLEHDFN